MKSYLNAQYSANKNINTIHSTNKFYISLSNLNSTSNLLKFLFFIVLFLSNNLILIKLNLGDNNLSSSNPNQLKIVPTNLSINFF